MRILRFAVLVLAGLHFSAASSNATSLRVSPVLIDLNAPTAASSLQIWNDAKRPINVQVRIFRWSQKNGVDNYSPATDVAVSPPISQLKPGGENMIRVVRTSKRPVKAEESYRVIVDELPTAAQKKSGTVNLVVRHSIPVFFSPQESKGADVVWNVSKKSGGYQVTVNNKGDKRMRIADLSLQSKGGAAVAQHPGLVGYVLGKSSVSWFIPGARNNLSGGSLTISAQSEAGPIHAKANVRGG